MEKIAIILLATISTASCKFGNKSRQGGKDRLVCVSKQITEYLFALGQGDKLVGIDLSSTYPPEQTKKLTTVGYHRMLSAEGIISLDPTLVVHDGNIGPANVLPQLEKAGITIKEYRGGEGMDSAMMLLKTMGKDY